MLKRPSQQKLQADEAATWVTQSIERTAGLAERLTKGVFVDAAVDPGSIFESDVGHATRPSRKWPLANRGAINIRLIKMRGCADGAPQPKSMTAI
jgi:hypothetical protein